jgi:16S rRNA (guanine527-N7)-methyltransferase
LVTLERVAAELGTALSPAVRDGLLVYCRLLLTWGERINLTAAKSVTAVVSEHLPDAFAIARLLARGDEAGQGATSRVVDVGAGGGLPALPLALLRPASSFVMFEATGKKVAFLRTAVRALSLGGRVEAQHARMDHPGPPFEGHFDVALSRATLPPPEWLDLGWRLVRPGGKVFCLSSRAIDEWPTQLDLVDQESYRPQRWIAELRRST